MLKLWRWRFANAWPTFPGLGSGFSLGSLLPPILTCREKSFTFDFSGLRGFSEAGGGGGGWGAIGCEGIPGDVCADLGKTRLAAAVAARVWLPRRPLW